MTLYLLDANVLMRANIDYYPIDRMPRFWPWLLRQAEAGSIKMPREIHGEIANGRDNLAEWVRTPDIKRTLILDEMTSPGRVRDVMNQGYGADLNDVEVKEIGNDPFLIAAAMGHPDRAVVTREVSSPSKKRANRKIPDICKHFNIKCINDFELWKKLDLRL